jgi:hypothetical protein
VAVPPVVGTTDCSGEAVIHHDLVVVGRFERIKRAKAK